MENEALKKAFRNLQERITRELVNPDSIIDELFAHEIISAQDYNDLYNVADASGRCRKFFGLLHLSSHPETFVQLRDALRNDYPKIVEEIDKQLTLQPAPQPQQPRMSQTTEGKFPIVLVLCKARVEDMLGPGPYFDANLHPRQKAVSLQTNFLQILLYAVSSPSFSRPFWLSLYRIRL